jgi:hypothetical protein
MLVVIAFVWLHQVGTTRNVRAVGVVIVASVSLVVAKVD